MAGGCLRPLRQDEQDLTKFVSCQRAGWPLATFKRHKEKAAGMIAHRLNVLGVGVW